MARYRRAFLSQGQPLFFRIFLPNLSNQLVAPFSHTSSPLHNYYCSVCLSQDIHLDIREIKGATQTKLPRILDLAYHISFQLSHFFFLDNTFIIVEDNCAHSNKHGKRKRLIFDRILQPGI